ncbi:MAG: hotdog domain-containing protein [Acidimicrobiales bacterium]|nr:hypothetical protein [Acidimicrobiales bacterium]
MSRPPVPEPEPRPYLIPEPGKLMGRGHSAGDFLQAWDWDVLDEQVGYLKVLAKLPDHVRNNRQQLFGGFTGTYIDLIGLHTVRSGPERTDPTMAHRYLATTNMRIDYFEPIMGPTFVIESRVTRSRGRDRFVVSEFFQDETIAVHALTQWKVL